MFSEAVRITGKFDGDPTNWKVPAIKHFRALTGLGLKEAKDTVESIHDIGGEGAIVELSGYTPSREHEHTERLFGKTTLSVVDQIAELEKAGYIVERTVKTPRDLLREASEIELSMGRFAEAAEITRILAEYY